MTMRSSQRAVPVGGEHAERHGDQRRQAAMVKNASDSVGSSRSTISSATCFLKKNDSPRSPCSVLADPDEELREDRLVEPEPLADVGDLLGVGVVAGDDGRRIAGRQAQHEEHEHRDDHHHRDGRGQPAQDVAEHRFRPIRCAAGYAASVAEPAPHCASVTGDVPEHRRRRLRGCRPRSCASPRRLIPLAERNVRRLLGPRAPARPRRSPSAWPDRSRGRSRRAASRSRASHGQPNSALSQLALRKPVEDRIE